MRTPRSNSMTALLHAGETINISNKSSAALRNDGTGVDFVEAEEGSSLESVDSASCVKITRHDPDAMTCAARPAGSTEAFTPVFNDPMHRVISSAEHLPCKWPATDLQEQVYAATKLIRGCGCDLRCTHGHPEEILKRRFYSPLPSDPKWSSCASREALISLFIGCFEEEQSKRCQVCALENSDQLVGHDSLSVHGGLLGEFKDRVQASKQYYEKNDVGGLAGSVDARKNIVCDTQKNWGSS